MDERARIRVAEQISELEAENRSLRGQLDRANHEDKKEDIRELLKRASEETPHEFRPSTESFCELEQSVFESTLNLLPDILDELAALARAHLVTVASVKRAEQKLHNLCDEMELLRAVEKFPLAQAEFAPGWQESSGTVLARSWKAADILARANDFISDELCFQSPISSRSTNGIASATPPISRVNSMSMPRGSSTADNSVRSSLLALDSQLEALGKRTQSFRLQCRRSLLERFGDLYMSLSAVLREEIVHIATVAEKSPKWRDEEKALRETLTDLFGNCSTLLEQGVAVVFSDSNNAPSFLVTFRSDVGKIVDSLRVPSPPPPPVIAGIAPQKQPPTQSVNKGLPKRGRDDTPNTGDAPPMITQPQTLTLQTRPPPARPIDPHLGKAPPGRIASPVQQRLAAPRTFTVSGSGPQPGPNESDDDDEGPQRRSLSNFFGLWK